MPYNTNHINYINYFLQWGITFKVYFKNIAINELYQLTDGTVHVETEGAQAYIAKFEDSLDAADSIPTDDEPIDTDTDINIPQDTISIDGVIDSVFVNPETGEKETTLITDSAGNSWTVDKEGNVTNGNSSTSDGTGNTQLALLEKLLLEILDEFDEEITQWLAVNGKGPLDATEMRWLLNLSSCLPEDEEALTYVQEVRMPEIENGIIAFIENINEDEDHKAIIENLVQGKSENQPLKEQLTPEQWEEGKEVVCGYLLKDIEKNNLKLKIIVQSINRTKDDFIRGDIINIDGDLLVMNNPDNNYLITINVDKEKAVEVEWSFIDINENNALMMDAFNNGRIKLGKKGYSDAKFWQQSDQYTLIKNETSNENVITKIDNFKSSVLFYPSGVGGDDYKVVAKVKDENGKTIKRVESQTLTVVRRIKFDNLYNMKEVRSLLNITSKANIQKYFIDAFIIYQEPASSNELSERVSVKYIGQYDRNNTITYEFEWTELAKPIDYNPAIRKSNGNIVRTEKLTDEEKNNCNIQSVRDKADSWKKRLLRSKSKSITNWKNDANLKNAIVSIENYHIMYGNNDDPDMDFNPFLPCTSVPITINGNTTYVGFGLWTMGDIGGVNLGNGLTIIPSWIVDNFDLTNTIAHEIAHTTNDIVNGTPIMYRVNFGAGDHSTTSGEGLMEPYPYRYGEMIKLGKIEIKILKGLIP